MKSSATARASRPLTHDAFMPRSKPSLTAAKVYAPRVPYEDTTSVLLKQRTFSAVESAQVVIAGAITRFMIAAGSARQWVVSRVPKRYTLNNKVSANWADLQPASRDVQHSNEQQ